MLTLIKLLLSVAAYLSKFAADRQLIKAGEAQALNAGIAEADDAINRARRARSGASGDPKRMQDDRANRDHWID